LDAPFRRATAIIESPYAADHTSPCDRKCTPSTHTVASSRTCCIATRSAAASRASAARCAAEPAVSFTGAPLAVLAPATARPPPAPPPRPARLALGSNRTCTVRPDRPASSCRHQPTTHNTWLWVRSVALPAFLFLRPRKHGRTLSPLRATHRRNPHHPQHMALGLLSPFPARLFLQRRKHGRILSPPRATQRRNPHAFSS